MCGIIGYAGSGDVGEIIYDGLVNLEYRGYDSAGMALAGRELTVAKRAGGVENLDPPVVPGASCGIGHTRWSTHGGPSDANAHPHTDCTDRVAVVHNGIIENYASLRAELADHEFTSETDTEVVPHLLEEELAAGASLLEAMRAVTERLGGEYALCALDRETEDIVVARHRSPLVLGHGEEGVFVASDVPAFLERTNRVTYLEDGQLARLTNASIEVFDGGEAIEYEVAELDWDAEAAQKGGYEHFMRKEIHEQPEALRRTLTGRVDQTSGTVDLDVDLSTEDIQTLEEVQFVAAGTSYYAAQYGAQLLEACTDLRTRVAVASEYRPGDGVDPDRTVAVAVTQSGETADTLAAIRAASGSGLGTLAVTNTLGSSVTREADASLFIKAGPEIGVAATKTFASQVVSLALLAVHFGRVRGTLSATQGRRLVNDLDGVPGAIQQVLDREDEVAAVASSYGKMESYFFIGREMGLPVAYEGALKLKEISYLHAEAFPAGELKHGPLALVSESTPVVAVLTDGAGASRTRHNVAEAQARGAPVIGIVSESVEGVQLSEAFVVPDVGLLEPLVANVYLQLFAYHIAKELGRSIDKPRHLAKSVTVK